MGNIPITIAIFSDNSRYEYRDGNFNKYNIYYVVDGKGHRLNGKRIIEHVQALAKTYNTKEKLLKINDLIDSIAKLNSVVLEENLKEMPAVIQKYKIVFKPEHSIHIEKISYLMFAIFYAEDRWIHPETGKPTKFGRWIYVDEFKRVGILGEDADEVSKLYTGQLPSTIDSLLNSTNSKIEKLKGRQRDLDEWFK